MENVTITIFVEPKSLFEIIKALGILDQLDIKNDYTVQHHDMIFTESMISNYVHLNVPVVLYTKFKECYFRSKQLANS